MSEGLQALTEKEKETLRLVVRGYDAKSMARHLGLSVHTVNERLRHARRKLEVSSSREAGRKLAARENTDREFLGPKPLGGASTEPVADRPWYRARTPLAWIAGGITMTLVLATILFATTPQAGVQPAPAALAPRAQIDPATLAASPQVAAALAWLALVDAGKWDESYAGWGEAFHKLNTAAAWTAINEKVRVPLGKPISRTPASQEMVPAPPNGYQMIKFETEFANGDNVLETVTLVREGGGWKIAGYVLD